MNRNTTIYKINVNTKNTATCKSKIQYPSRLEKSAESLLIVKYINNDSGYLMLGTREL